MLAGKAFREAYRRWTSARAPGNRLRRVGLERQGSFFSGPPGGERPMVSREQGVRCDTVSIRRPCGGLARFFLRCMSRRAEEPGLPNENERMHQQPELTSPSLPASPAQQPGPGLVSASASGTGNEVAHPAAPPEPQRIPRWLERAELFLRVLLRMYIGLAVCYAPWSRMFWDQNPIFLQFPTLSIYAANGAVRGLVSGLGLLNLWIAFHDAIWHGADKQ